jgi:hypothetical protein
MLDLLFMKCIKYINKNKYMIIVFLWKKLSIKVYAVVIFCGSAYQL